MGYGAYVFVVIAALVIFFAALSQVLSYRRGQSLVTQPHLLLRVGTALLLLAVLGLSVWGLLGAARGTGVALTQAQRLSEIRTVAGYWSVVMVLLLGAIVLALLDLRYVHAAQHRARAEMFQNMARLQAEIKAAAEKKRREGKQD
jgi:hypothetical protein